MCYDVFCFVQAEDRLRLSVAGKKKRVESVGVGVSPQAQTLFDKLSMQSVIRIFFIYPT